MTYLLSVHGGWGEGIIIARLEPSGNPKFLSIDRAIVDMLVEDIEIALGLSNKHLEHRLSNMVFLGMRKDLTFI